MLIVLGTFAGCGRQMVSDELANADTLLAAEENDSAYQVVADIKERYIDNEADLAHYHLLLTRTSLLTGHPVPPDSCIDHAISYYEQEKDYSNLAEAYFYKGRSLVNRKEHVKAMRYCKLAEQQAMQSADPKQQHKIVEEIAYINSITGNYQLQLQSAKKALQLANALQDKNRIAFSYNSISIAYIRLNQPDSAYIYAQKTIPYLQYINQRDLPYFLTNIGASYRKTDPEKAKYYCEKALTYKVFSSTLECLADIYYDEGKPEEAYRLWKKALTVGDGTPQDYIIYNILEYDIQHGNTDNVLEKVNEIMDIKDSIQAKLASDTLKELQLRFDHEVEKHKLDRQLDRSIIAIVVLIAVVIAITSYVLIKQHKYKLFLTKTQMQIDNYTAQIHQLEESGNDVKEEIDHLKRKITELTESGNQRTVRGILLYNKLKAGDTMVEWTKDDYNIFIEYYNAIDHDTIKKYRKMYKNITPRNLVFLLLYDWGKSDDEICKMMALSPEGMRSMRFRIAKKRNKPEET